MKNFKIKFRAIREHRRTKQHYKNLRLGNEGRSSFSGNYNRYGGDALMGRSV